jgi:hypothetical protein
MIEAPSFDGTQECINVDPEMFFPDMPEKITLPETASLAERKEQKDNYENAMEDYREKVEQAKAICSECPFVEPCFVYAMQNDVYGIWGNTTENERRNFRRRNRIPAPKSMIANIDFWVKEKGAF